MIEAAMMFGLGVFVSGLLALSFFGAYARRTRRVIERRLRARVAVGRAEVDAERDELRARHAVEVRRLEREIGHLRDQSTAFRLYGDVKDHELSSLRAQLASGREQTERLETRLEASRGEMRSLDHNLAEQAAALRTARLELERKERRRAAAAGAVDETADPRPQPGELEALRAEIKKLKRKLASRDTSSPPSPATERAVAAIAAESHADRSEPVVSVEPEPGEPDGPGTANAVEAVLNDNSAPPMPDEPEPDARAARREVAVAKKPPEHAASPGQRERADSADPEPARESDEAENIREIASQIHRLVDETAADLAQTASRYANGAAHANGAPEATGEAEAEDEALKKQRLFEAEQQAAEARFKAAMDEIRSLKRAGDATPGQ